MTNTEAMRREIICLEISNNYKELSQLFKQLDEEKNFEAIMACKSMATEFKTLSREYAMLRFSEMERV